MHQKWFRTLTLLPALLVMFFVFMTPASAQAADGWLPDKFEQSTRTYLDPALANDPSYPVRLDPSTQNALQELGQAQGVEYYFVFTKKSATAVVPSQYGGNTGYGRWQLDMLINKWAGQPGFPSSNYVVIVLVRSDRNPDAYVWAANSGSGLKQYGVDNVLANLLQQSRDKYINSKDYKHFATYVAEGVNQRVVDWKAEQAAAEAHDRFMAALPMYLGIGFVVLLVVGGFLFLVFRTRGAKKRLSTRLGVLGPELDSVNAFYGKLKNGNAGFIKDQSAHKEKLTGKSKADFLLALDQYQDFSVRRTVFDTRFVAAQQVLTRANWLLGAGALNAAYASVTTESITVEGNELELNEVTDVTGGTVKKTTFDNLDALKKNLTTLFQSANGLLQEIITKFQGAEQNKRDIANLFAQIDTEKPELEKEGLNFAPYQGAYDKLKSEVDTTLADIASNPVERFADSERIERAVETLKSALLRAVAIKKSFSSTAEAIAAARQTVATTRATALQFAYPLVEGEEAPKTAIGDFSFSVKEKDADPDTSLTEADRQLKAAETAVLAGKLDEADTAKAAAEKASATASQYCKDVVDAKAFVEEQVTPIRADLQALNDELSPAEVALTELKSSFLAANFEQHPGYLKGATTVRDTTESELAVVREAYYEQRFVAARKALESINNQVDSSRDNLKKVHARLKELRQLRKHAKETVVAAETLSTQLTTKRSDNQFTTAVATDDAHTDLEPKLTAARSDVDKQITDWPAAAETADTLLSELKAIDAAIGEQKAAYALAKTKVATVAANISEAEKAFLDNSGREDNDVRQPARDALATAKTTLGTLQRTLKTAKSNWAQLVTTADGKAHIGDNAKNLALADKRLAKEASDLVDDASDKIRGYANKEYKRSKSIGGSSKSFGGNVEPDLRTARTSLESAERALRNREYENAKTYAGTAIERADAADVAAALIVTTLINDAVRDYNNSQISTSSGSGSSGSGSIGGGDFGSIGGSIGGGDSGGATGGSVGGGDAGF